MPNSDTHTNDIVSETTLRLMASTVEELRDPRGALLPILHAIQKEFGSIPEETIPIIAGALNQTRADVFGVVSFYSDFRTTQSGRSVVQICQAESCQALGSSALVEAARKQLGINFEQTTQDEAFTLRKVFCLGNCARSPSIMIDAELHGRVTPERLGTILEEVRSRR
jgi:formate dehydrogenase subunit gamma